MSCGEEMGGGARNDHQPSLFSRLEAEEAFFCFVFNGFFLFTCTFYSHSIIPGHLFPNTDQCFFVFWVFFSTSSEMELLYEKHTSIYNVVSGVDGYVCYLD